MITPTQPPNNTTTLTQIIEPLAAALQRYAGFEHDEIQVVDSTFEGLWPRDNETFITLHTYFNHPDLVRALWTIIEASDSNSRWLDHSVSADTGNPYNPYEGPIVFGLLQQRYGSRPYDRRSYLCCYSRDDGFDTASANRQVAKLVNLIGDAANLLPLTPERQLSSPFDRADLT